MVIYYIVFNQNYCGISQLSIYRCMGTLTVESLMSRLQGCLLAAV